MPDLPPTAIGAIVVATIAGLISLLGLIISKEQKVSDFRQAWIDGLRSEISALISHANAIHGSAIARPSDASQAWATVRPDYVGINEAAANIRLRLNPKEEPSIAVLNTVAELEALLASGATIEHTRLNSLEKELVSRTQIVLKQEWIRVRSGERVYRFTRGVALVFLLTCSTALVVVLASWVLSG